ncbi:glutathione S-transferase family protein [Puniceibacterium sp. IMCC21224]|uniref:glutathione S-transferase family protein n=1 Tax=Puniceibacterium sp. IMCC21224 TaxID=1618204 RepID=UPI00064DE89F|nr:glutathione S-transferase family protein [Puniceibacterium sp. IMCC21224]KMK65164.1 glutathione S-transferase [Puniceibacterium sp. IMCC21224]
MLLYHAANSVCSQKVRLCLAEIGLGYDTHRLDLMKGDQFASDYLTLNPDAVVPTLVDAGHVIVESSLICDYLDRTYNHGRLMPSDPAAGIAVRHWLLRSLALHGAINTLTFATANRGAKFRGLTAEEREAKLAKMPNPVARLKLISLTDDGLASPFVAQALTDLSRAFGDMGTVLLRQDWLSGAAFGLGDIGVLPYVDRLEHLSFGGLWQARHPEIADWLARMRARPSYADAVLAVAPAGSLERMRENGTPHWPDIAAMWAATDAGSGPV